MIKRARIALAAFPHLNLPPRILSWCNPDRIGPYIPGPSQNWFPWPVLDVCIRGQVGMKSRIMRVWLFLLLVPVASRAASPDSGLPQLLVVVTLDQFGAGYLERYDQVFTGGLRRLRDEGRRFDRATVDHAPTLSYPGHTTISTGSHPRTHGINANDWLETQPDGEVKRVLVSIDADVQILGHPDLIGLSPKNLRVTALADWIRAAHQDARAVALSTGTALAQYYGGRALADESRNHAYWLSGSQGVFVTSTYFRSSYPDWVTNFNENHLPRFKTSSVWHNTVPAAYHSLARPDATGYEGDGQHTTFPHRFDDVWDETAAGDTEMDTEAARATAFNRWFWNSPFADEALFALAREAVRTLALGQRQTTDLLAIAVKSTDRHGHDFGPRSLEQLDILVRLDRLIASFLAYLDENVGPQNYIVVLTADHGSPNIVEYEIEQGNQARRVSEQDIQEVLKDIENFIVDFPGQAAQLTDAIARQLERVDFIARAMTPAELAGTGPCDEILRAFRNSYLPGRNTTYPLWTREVLYGTVGASHPVHWGIMVELAENAQIWTAKTTHGSSHLYDREVPIIFMGGNILPGISTEAARTVDIAPTLAALARLSCPDTVDGMVLRLD